MGALTIIRKRGEETFLSYPNSSEQSYSHIAKKPKISVSMFQKTPDCNRSPPSSSVVSRLSQYPLAKKSGFPREVHCPVRNLKFGQTSAVKRTEATHSSRESEVDTMGKFSFFNRMYERAKISAMKTLRHVLPGKQECKEVIEVGSENEDRDNAFDDSSIEELENLHSVKNVRNGKQVPVENSGELNAKKVKKEDLSLDSSVISDVSNAAIAKVDGGEKAQLSLLDQVPDSGVPVYKRLLFDSGKKDSKRADLDFAIELEEKRLQGYHISRPQKKEVLLKKVSLCHSYENFRTLCSFIVCRGSLYLAML